MFWELGEHIKLTLDTTGLTEARVTRWCSWAACWCEQRRTWLNELGEAIWTYAVPLRANRTRERFAALIRYWLEPAPLSQSILCRVVRQDGIKVSEHTIARWLSQMVASGALSELNAGGERWLSLR